MLTVDQKIEHLKKLGFPDFFTEIRKMYEGKPFDTSDYNYKRLLAESASRCGIFNSIITIKNRDTQSRREVERQRRKLLDELFPGHGKGFMVNGKINAVIGMVDVGDFAYLSRDVRFEPTTLVELGNFVGILPSVTFGNQTMRSDGTISVPDKIIVGDKVSFGPYCEVRGGVNIAPKQSFVIGTIIAPGPVSKKTITKRMDIPYMH